VDKKPTAEEIWGEVLNGNIATLQRNRAIFGLLPSEPRCRFCNAPFAGFGSLVSRYIFHLQQSNLNPRMCTQCENFAQEFPGGVEIEITMLFTDIRGSTTMAENIRPAEFTRILNRFYSAAANTLIPTDAWIDKLVGDEVIALFIPGFVGPHHASIAIHAAQQLLKAVGYGKPEGAWIPIGVGVHTDTVFVGSVGSQGITDITAIGDGMNTTARLVSNAAAGEVIISEAARKAANFDLSSLEQRDLQLKGRSEPIRVRVIHADTALPDHVHA
jgi:adenylate cyclase